MNLRLIAHLVALSFVGAGGIFAAEKPNIVVIMADDMGYSDLGCYGGEIKTPVLDQMASNGLRFRRFYNAARCCPTRASLLSGLYPQQAGIGAMVGDLGYPGYQGHLSRNCVTLAEVLKGAGYQTLICGKWHVSRNPYAGKRELMDPEGWPLQRGFDRFYGTLAGGGNYYRPVSLARDNELLDMPEGDYYYTNAISTEAAKYIKDSDKEKPLFLYFTPTAPHWPLHAPDDEIEPYMETYRVGWDAIRQQRHQRMIELGVLNANCPLSERSKGIVPWSQAKDKEWEARRMATHAAMVTIMDRSIGQIIEALKKTGRYENTMILFLSDNGASAEVIRGKSNRHGNFARGGTTPDVMPGPADTYSSFGRSWANASNTPFRYYKKDTYAGGACSPLIIHWPAGISAPGEWRDQQSHIIDIMPTVVKLSGATYPHERAGQPVKSMAGKSLLASFDDNQQAERPIFFEHMGNRGVRMGRWALLSARKNPWSLYDISVDRTESVDLAKSYPEKVEEMESLYETWAEQSDVLPWPPGAKR